jgi:uncharacterized membrane protein YvlD (DUF360 family)
MSNSSNVSLPVRIILHLLLTIGVIWLLNIFFDQYFALEGGVTAYIVVGSLLTLMNLIARPLLALILLPFRLFFHLITLIISNALFLWLTQRIADRFDPSVVVLYITDSWASWLFIALCLGLTNWLIKEIVK